ncbi:hypothetical protein B0H63DRAFT_527138 [Podospora didyma]|uniref:Rhodopsin domain-containing protein n=1 Tax=Podospora didyma TaxID=330526 RepID=A0AAE0KA17_9PEZI|nr:hypothetical protein B0H63DRAFT_527138 [Podospora didyma]
MSYNTTSQNAPSPSVAYATGIGGAGVNIVTATWISWVLALFSVGLRFYTRTRLMHVLGASDWVLAGSLVAALGLCISKTNECAHGMGRHVWDIDFMAERKSLLQGFWFTVVTYQLTLALTKVSICLLYLKIFVYPWALRACRVLLGIVTLSSLWCIVTLLTACIPLQAFWDSSVKGSFCHKPPVWWGVTGVPVFTDVLVCIFPIPMVIRLTLPRRQKILVVGVFTGGFLVCLVSLIRLAITIQSARNPSNDMTYYNVPVTFSIIIEVHTAIAVASIMTLKPLIAKFFPSLLDQQNVESSNSYISGTDSPPTIGSKPSRNDAGDAPRPNSRVDSLSSITVTGAIEANLEAQLQKQQPAEAPSPRAHENEGNIPDKTENKSPVVTVTVTRSQTSPVPTVDEGLGSPGATRVFAMMAPRENGQIPY